MFRWFLDMEMDEASFDHSTFLRNGLGFWSMRSVASSSALWLSRRGGSDCFRTSTFTVDGTLIEAWASIKSFRRKDTGPSQSPDDPGNPNVAVTI